MDVIIFIYQASKEASSLKENNIQNKSKCTKYQVYTKFVLKNL